MKRASVLVLLVIGMTLVAAPGQAASSTEVRGDFVQAAGMVTGYDLETGKISAVGVATVNGDLTGLWKEEIEFTLDPETADARGTSRQTFFGRAEDGSSGTLDVLEYFTVDGSTHQLHGEGKILGGTGDWAGSHGYYWADGLNAGDGFGTWHAHWVRPR